MSSPVRATFARSEVGTDRAIGTSFDATKRHDHDLMDNVAAFQAGQHFLGKVSTITVQVKSISDAAKVTMRLTTDAAGNESIIPDTEATISVGISDATTGTVAYSVGAVLYQPNAATRGTVYLHIKVDAGSLTLDRSIITTSDT